MSTRTSSEIRDAIDGADPSARLARVNAIELRSVVARLESALTHGLTAAQGGDVSQPAIGFVMSSPVIDQLQRARTALALIEVSPAYKVTVEQVEPLYAELEVALAREDAEREALTAAEIALRNAREAAQSKAQAAIDKDAAVKAALGEVERLKARHPEHVVVPEPVKPTALEAYHGDDVARELAADHH